MTEARTAPIKFTGAMVQEVAERAKRITGGRFELGQIKSHPDGGPVYLDARRDIAWYGALGARQACAYYSGAALRTARLEGRVLDTEDADFLMKVQVAYTRGGSSSRDDRESFDKWESEGAEDAEKLITDETS